MSRISTIRIIASPQVKLGLVLAENATAPSISKPNKRVETGLRFSDELPRTGLMVVWEL